MCFSATASFTVAAATGAIGIAGLRQVRHRREIPLAVIPVLFAAQQTVEGTLWLLLPDDGDGAQNPAVTSLSLAFLLIAEVVWPLIIPLAVFLVEPLRRRRLIFQIIAALGVIISIDLCHALLTDLPTAVVRGHSIRYPSYVEHLSWQQSLYLLCTCVSLLVSSHRMVQAVGAVVIIGLAVSAYAYYATLVSVWCFFAAADSTLLYFHFKRLGAAARSAPDLLEPAHPR